MKNVSSFDTEEFKIFNLYSTKRIIVQVFFLDIVMICFSLLAYYLGKYPLMIIALVVAVLASILILIYRKYKINATSLKVKDEFKNSSFEYEFNEKELQIRATINGHINTLKIDYYSFTKIIETKKSFILMLSAREAYFVTKDGFENKDDVLKVQELLINCSQRYIKK